MLETLVKNRASAYPPPRLFSFLPCSTLSVLSKHIHTVNLHIYRYQTSKKRKGGESPPTRRAFWQALVRTAKRLESESEVVWKRTTKQPLFFPPLPVSSLLNKHREMRLSSILSPRFFCVPCRFFERCVVAQPVRLSKTFLSPLPSAIGGRVLMSTPVEVNKRFYLF